MPYPLPKLELDALISELDVLRLEPEDTSFVDNVVALSTRRERPTLPRSSAPSDYLRLLYQHPHQQSILRGPRVFNFLNPPPTLRQPLLSAIQMSETEYSDMPNHYETNIDYVRGFPRADEHIHCLLDSVSPNLTDARTLLVMISGEKTGADPIGYAVADCSVNDASKFTRVVFELRMVYVIPAFRSQGYGTLLVHLLQNLIVSIYDHIKVRSNFPGISNFLTGTLKGPVYNDFSASMYERLAETFTGIVSSDNFILDTYPSEHNDYRQVFHNMRESA